MKVIAIGTAVKPITDEERARYMPKEAPHTLQLHIDGVLEQMELVSEQHRASLDVAVLAIGVGEANLDGAVEHDIHTAKSVRQRPKIRRVVW